MAKASVELQGLEPHSLASSIATLFTSWNAERQVWLKRVREVIQYIYATSTRETANTKNPWSHSTHIPKLTQIYDNLGANYAQALFGSREFFAFEPATKKEATAAKSTAIVNYLTTKHDYSGFRGVMKTLLEDWVRTGNCFARVEYVRETTVDTDTGEEIVQYEGPKPIRISPYDIVFDHMATSFMQTPKIIRSVMTRGELFRKVDNDPEADYDMTEIERVRKFYSIINGWKDSEINKFIQLQMDGFSGSSGYFRSGKVELLDFIGDIYDTTTGTLNKDQIITVLDRRFVIRRREIRDYQGFGRIYHSSWRKRPENLWGMGPLDNLVGLQYLINHLENARADAFDQMLTPDRVHIGNVQVEQDGPVTNYYVDDAAGDVKNLAPDATVLSADNQIALKEAQMEAYAGAPREALGFRTPGEKTKFEVAQLTNAAGRLFQKKIEDFEEEMIEPLLNGELEISVRNLNTSDVAKVLDDDFGVLEFITITKEDLTARGKLKARGASTFAKKAQLVQELREFNAVVTGDPSLAVHFPAKARAEAWNEALGLDRFEMFKPFGQIEEDLEKQELITAAQNMADEFQSAGVTDANAQVDVANEFGPPA